jgi:glycosyltransferase involved in cell wall biosynthesis
VAINNIKVIYPGTPKLALTTILKSKHEYVTFGYLGRLASEKGVNVLLAAFATLKHHNVLPHPTRIKLLIAGKGPAEKDLKRLAVDLGLKDNVVFLGMIKKKTDFFSQVDCVIIPSIQAESFGLTIIESMMAGLPVIASRIGAIPEIIEHKKTGLLFKPGDKTAIVDCVNWLFCDDIRKQRLKKQAYEVVCSRFTEQQMLNTYRNLLRQY